MAHVDDLEVGDQVAVTAFRRRVRRSRPFGDGADEELEWDELDCSGEPLEILAIALPFLAVVNRLGERGILDVRNVKVAASNARVVRALSGELQPRRSQAEVREAKRDAVAAKRCGYCGGKMSERLLNSIRGEWGLVCPTCDAADRSRR